MILSPRKRSDAGVWICANRIGVRGLHGPGRRKVKADLASYFMMEMFKQEFAPKLLPIPSYK